MRSRVFHVSRALALGTLAIVAFSALELSRLTHSPLDWPSVHTPNFTRTSHSVNGPKSGNSSLYESASARVAAIMDPQHNGFDRLVCPAPITSRYHHLRGNSTQYFFGLDVYQNAAVLPRLIGSIVDAIRFLGPGNCALSIVEGRSGDGTYETLTLLQSKMAELGVAFFLTTNEIDPWAPGGDRIDALATLRNQALLPLVQEVHRYSEDTTIVFLNDVAVCMEDILELIHQHIYQNAHMICGMDWVYVGNDPTFHDVWIARGMNGDTFFDIPEDGNWNSAWNLFWNNEYAKSRWITNRPFQVFSCWNGAVAFTAKPILERTISFRKPYKGECYQGEPQLFCKDLWNNGYKRIAVVPSINLEYNDNDARRIKEAKGYVQHFVGNEDQSARIQWQPEPPSLVKCMPNYENQFWLPWDEQLAEHDVFPGI